MAFVSDLFDQLRDLLNDASDTQVPYATKKLFLNNGIRRLWPRVYRLTSTTTTILTETFDYALPVGAADGLVTVVELENDYGYTRFNDYDLIDGDEDTAGVLRLTRNPDSSDLLGYDLRINYAAPVPLIAAASYAAAGSETWTGPDRAIHLPVLYAMSMIASRRLDDRQDHTRYSTTQAMNGVSDTDILQAASYWMGQFEAELNDMTKPLPIARD
jgi:hypothetical protein